MIPTPSIGRIIHAVVREQRPAPQVGKLITRPAIIVRTWGDEATYVNAQVFCDSDGGISNDGLPNVLWKTSLIYDSTGQLENSWHWPTRN